MRCTRDQTQREPTPRAHTCRRFSGVTLYRLYWFTSWGRVLSIFHWTRGTRHEVRTLERAPSPPDSLTLACRPVVAWSAMLERRRAGSLAHCHAAPHTLLFPLR
jgi:hypothetical protein